MIFLFFVFSFLLAVVNAANPQATVKGNQVITGRIESNGVESFKGIPFAEPPLGALRFARPKAYNGSYNGLQASDFSKSCVQIDPAGALTLINGILNAPLVDPLLKAMAPAVANILNMGDMDENCLFLNVYRPAGSKPGDNLPVMVWIYGGAFFLGSASTYNGAHYIAASQRINQPVIVVTMNYRLGVYGFLGGTAVKEEDNGNAGLLDQRAALQWVQDNIGQFGGNPEKVTVFGESAGAMSTFAHLVSNDGDIRGNSGKPLFRGAIMQSGAVLPQDYIDSPFPQKMFTQFAGNAGCGGLNNVDTMYCLRSKSASTITKAQNSFSALEFFGIPEIFDAYSPRCDYSYLRDSPRKLLRSGKIAKIPYITGNQEDEGTLISFALKTLTSYDFRNALDKLFYKASNAQKTKIEQLYPPLLSAGAPFRTGIFNAVTPQFKRMAALLTDLLFHSGRRQYLQSTSDISGRWNYFATTLHNLVPTLGTFHANDLIWQWFLDLGPYKVYQDYFIAFANHLDPNVGVSLRNWPKYTDNGKETLLVTLSDLSVTTDNFRQTEIQYLIDEPDATAMKRRDELSVEINDALANITYEHILELEQIVKQDVEGAEPIPIIPDA